MLKATIRSAKVRVRAHWTSDGSVFAGTITSQCHSVEIDTSVESDDDAALIAAVIRNAQGGCYADAALTNAVPVHRVTNLNGSRLIPEDFPRKVPRRNRPRAQDIEGGDG